MASIAQPQVVAQPITKPATGIWSWLTTIDHKRIGFLYGVSAFFFLLLGGVEALIIRTQLAQPDHDVVSAQRYNELFTMHGTTMIFLALMPMSTAFFNYIMPLQIGARDVAFPRLNAYSYWIFLAGGDHPQSLLVLQRSSQCRLVWIRSADISAWNPGRNVDFWLIGLQILGVASMVACIQHDRHGHQHARSGHDDDADADFQLDDADRVDTDGYGLSSDHGALILLGFDRYAGTGFYEAGRWWRSAALAAPFLGLRSSRGVHSDSAGFWHHF